ncbi:MAG: adenine phosphoribosyltransferase [Corallincola sp.]|nr:adenine phosphoribosyltransferase [Corallincola sp.]
MTALPCEALLKASIKSIPDYPKPGIIFRDVTSLMENGEAFACAIDALLAPFVTAGVTKVVGAEARGFIFGAPLALRLGAGFVPVRKPRKLPRETLRESYALEYGTDTLEIHTDAIQPGERVLLVDDLLATGGTILATAQLVQRLGGTVVGAAFVVGLPDLPGEGRLRELGIEPHVLVRYAGH